jgi:hypothetical protein
MLWQYILDASAAERDARPIHIRVAQVSDHSIALDLGDDTGRAVLVSSDGWNITADTGVLFRRSALTAPMREPERGGSLRPMRRLMNVSDDEWDLLVGYMVAAWIPAIPHPVLFLTGEQGTGKTSAMRLIASLLDPSSVSTRTAPRDIQNWVVSLSACWVTGVDNLSRIEEWLSDAICRACTGDGLVRRQLYADNDIVVNRLRIVILLNGIGVGSLRGDLGDRLVPIELQRIDSSSRRLEARLQAEWETEQALVTGALLDLLVQTLRILPTVELAVLPRMADFARVLGAVDILRGSRALSTYLHSREAISEQVVEGDEVAAAVRRLAETQAGPETMDGIREWTGTATELLAQLDDLVPVARRRANRSWPNTAQQLSQRLRRSGPDLARLGVDVRAPTSNKHKLWKISLAQTDQEPDGRS